MSIYTKWSLEVGSSARRCFALPAGSPVISRRTILFYSTPNTAEVSLFGSGAGCGDRLQEKLLDVNRCVQFGICAIFTWSEAQASEWTKMTTMDQDVKPTMYEPPKKPAQVCKLYSDVILILYI